MVSFTVLVVPLGPVTVRLFVRLPIELIVVFLVTLSMKVLFVIKLPRALTLTLTVILALSFEMLVKIQVILRPSALTTYLTD